MIPIWSVINILFIAYCNGQNHIREKSYYAYCDQSLSYCYYSDSEPLDAMSTPEADLFCQSVNENGRLLDFAEVGELNKVKTFMANYSLHKVLLNAINENGVWKWIQQGNDITMNSNLITKGDQLFYMLRPENFANFYVVCKSECKPNWVLKKKKNGNSKNILKFSAENIKSCQDLCEANETCVGIDWIMKDNEKCGLLMERNYIYVSNPLVMHFVIDRSSKSVEKCVGLVRPEKYATVQSTIHRNSNDDKVERHGDKHLNQHLGLKRDVDRKYPFFLQPAKDNRRSTSPIDVRIFSKHPRFARFNDDMFKDYPVEIFPEQDDYFTIPPDLDDVPEETTTKLRPGDKKLKTETQPWFYVEEPTNRYEEKITRSQSQILPNKKSQNPLMDYWWFSVLSLGITIGCSLSAGSHDNSEQENASHAKSSA